MKTLAAVLVLLALAGCSTESRPPAIIPQLVSDSSPFPEFSIADSETAGFKPAKAIVRAVLGEVQFGNGGAWDRLRINLELANGTLIRTGHGSSTYVQVNGFISTIRVTEDSELDLTEMMGRNTDATRTALEDATRTALEVRKGTILGSVRRLSSESAFQVRGGGVTLKVHGTDFQMSAEGRADMITGAATVTSDGKSYKVTTGECFDPKKNEVFSVPYELIPVSPVWRFGPPFPVNQSWPGTELLPPFERGMENALHGFPGH